MTQRRNRIGEDLMEMLQMLKFTLKSGGISLDFSVGTSEAEVIELIQTQMEAEDNVPQDINGFIQSLLSQVA
ncbi:hypothetical protein CPC08DRAFT_651682 [Agrocybe pediades]|nr:hypothetical protein CPC08DRAFT_651682 [Agrocybe pediades]